MSSPKGRILCTEDDPDTRELIAVVLEREGYDVTCIESPAHALDLARATSFDLYLVDNWMPGLSGTQLTAKLREFDKNTPILFYSAAAYRRDAEEARLAGAQGYLTKPVANDDLIAEVARLIAESKSRSQ